MGSKSDVKGIDAAVKRQPTGHGLRIATNPGRGTASLTVDYEGYAQLSRAMASGEVLESVTGTDGAGEPAAQTTVTKSRSNIKNNLLPVRINHVKVLRAIPIGGGQWGVDVTYESAVALPPNVPNVALSKAVTKGGAQGF